MILSKNKNIWGTILVISSSGLSLCYPFIFYFYGQDFSFLGFMSILFFLMILRCINNSLTKKSKFSFIDSNILMYMGLVGTTMLSINYWDSRFSPYLYPVITNFALGIIFAKSLLSPQTLIEQLARLREPDLDAHGVAYTRKVTIAWAVFCFINGLVSGAIALYADFSFWALYNGVFSYCLIGLMMTGEFIIRCSVKSKKNCL